METPELYSRFLKLEIERPVQLTAGHVENLLRISEDLLLHRQCSSLAASLAMTLHTHVCLVQFVLMVRKDQHRPVETPSSFLCVLFSVCSWPARLRAGRLPPMTFLLMQVTQALRPVSIDAARSWA